MTSCGTSVTYIHIFHSTIYPISVSKFLFLYGLMENIVKKGLSEKYWTGPSLKSSSDPGFPRGSTYSSTKFSRKLHENEENWAEGARPKYYHVDPPQINLRLTTLLSVSGWGYQWGRGHPAGSGQ